jgi:predicted amidophosphoribosyltransferase
LIVFDQGGSGLAGAAAGLVDLVLPGGCAACGRAGTPLRYGVCAGCVIAVARLRPHPTRPEPAPAGLPPCVALGDYAGVLRELVLAYKDRGRHRLARPRCARSAATPSSSG